MGLGERREKSRSRQRILATTRRFIDSQWVAREELETQRLELLRKRLAHAVRATRYYAELFESRHLDVRDVRSLSDFREAVPILEKDVVRDRLEDFVSSEWKGRVKNLATTGSTGRPMALMIPKPNEAVVAMRGLIHDMLGVTKKTSKLRMWSMETRRSYYFDFKENIHRFPMRESSTEALDELASIIVEHDVAILMREGTIETAERRIGAHGVAFFPGGQPHGLKNVAAIPARYLVFEFHNRPTDRFGAP